MSTYTGHNFKDAKPNKDFLNRFPKEFLSAWEKTMRWEGGAVAHNVSGDTGGWTKYGISQKAYPKLDIKNLSARDAIELAYYDYWALMQCDKIAEYSPIAAGHVFDIGFNMGHRWGIKMLQRAINQLHNAKVLKDDGIYGRLTHAELQCVNPESLNNALRHVRIKRFKWLATVNPINRKFLKGWTNRANDFA